MINLTKVVLRKIKRRPDSHRYAFVLALVREGLGKQGQESGERVAQRTVSVQTDSAKFSLWRHPAKSVSESELSLSFPNEIRMTLNQEG